MKYILPLLFALTLSAQTNIPLSALRADAPSERLLVYVPSIGILAIQFDPSQITIDRSTTPFTLKVAQPAPAPPAPAETRINIKPAVGVILSEYTLPEPVKAGSLRFFRNGLLLTEGDDYTVVSNATGGPTVKFVASQFLLGPSAAGVQGDTAVVLYVKE